MLGEEDDTAGRGGGEGGGIFGGTTNVGVSAVDRGEERCDAVFQALGPCEGYAGAGPGGDARHLRLLQHPSSPWDKWHIRNTSLAETRRVVSRVASSHWRRFMGPFGHGAAVIGMIGILATVGFACAVWRTVKVDSDAVARRVAWDRAAEDLANARARRANAIAAQTPTHPGLVVMGTSSSRTALQIGGGGGGGGGGSTGYTMGKQSGGVGGGFTPTTAFLARGGGTGRSGVVMERAALRTRR